MHFLLKGVSGYNGREVKYGNFSSQPQRKLLKKSRGAYVRQKSKKGGKAKRRAEPKFSVECSLYFWKRMSTNSEIGLAA